MKFQTDLEQLFDIVSEKSLKVLDDNIRKLYLDQKFGTHKEILSNNVPVSNLTTTMMGIDESSKYLRYLIIIKSGSSVTFHR